MKTHQTSSTSLAVALCTLGLGVSACFAGDTAKTSHESGTITSVNAAKHELVVNDSRSNKPQTFTWNNSTKFRENEKTVAASELKAGQQLHLSYKPGTGASLLEDVMILPAKATGYQPKTK